MQLPTFFLATNGRLLEEFYKSPSYNHTKTCDQTDIVLISSKILLKNLSLRSLLTLLIIVVDNRNKTGGHSRSRDYLEIRYEDEYLFDHSTY
ncbi:hypothetical protein KUTeg_022193 [Tegillarca granosa]|uniref:Uncharacterized protein n=1 Tax=Tegillarca granosa TaxID=220873 RepID=A0ABQ9E8G3_TEGGR|nr:hypothetical protein KUTeg_022193 [Tegillarca granosa]